MDMENIFKPDSYTEKSMPVSSILCDAISAMGDLDHVSTAVSEVREKSQIKDKDFFNSLNEKQTEMFNEYYERECEETTIELHEYFNKGLKFGAMLMLELLG